MRIFASCFTLTVFASFSFAHSYGPPPRVTGAPGDNARACTVCHSGSGLNSGSGSVKIVLPSGPGYIPGVKQRITVQVSDPSQSRWGFELTARLNSDLVNGQAGDFNPIDNQTQVICDDAGPKPCATGVQFIEHTSVGTRLGTPNGASFQFDWTPPETNAGPVTMFVAGNAANGNAASTGDLIYTSSVQLTPLTVSAPVVSAATNIVSAVTSVAGPLAANSWVTVYGTNLSATTRGWAATDFTNGAMPYSLDGVSVILTQFGAPRSAYIGYVSPTQINFLMPSDASATSTTLVVKNPAGTSAAQTITVQGNTPGLFTVDGKSVLGAHGDGTLVSKAAPAAPGEPIILYATGCGPTNPALIPGLVPTQPSSLVSLPSVTIGASSATVLAGTVVPGSAGVYQIKVQIPSDAPNGDLPLSVKLGTGTPATAVITVQK
jgi:uncharacterized protein (TIGR03437 family)